MSEENPLKGVCRQLTMSSDPSTTAASDEYAKQLERMVDQYKKELEGI